MTIFGWDDVLCPTTHAKRQEEEEEVDCRRRDVRTSKLERKEVRVITIERVTNGQTYIYGSAMQHPTYLPRRRSSLSPHASRHTSLFVRFLCCAFRASWIHAVFVSLRPSLPLAKISPNNANHREAERTNFPTFVNEDGFALLREAGINRSRPVDDATVDRASYNPTQSADLCFLSPSLPSSGGEKKLHKREVEIGN